MSLSPELKPIISEFWERYRVGVAVNRVPHPANFAKLSAEEQAASIELIQQELDLMAEGLRSRHLLPNRGGSRGAALRNIRNRQKRLEKLATEFGFRREWRKRVKVTAISRPHLAA